MSNPTDFFLDSAKPSLLVVDDEPDFAELVEAVAEEVGYDVTVVTDPMRFPLAYRRDIDVIVLDLSMPDLDGIELIRFLAENRGSSALILVSGFDNHILEAARLLAHGHKLPVIAALQKPVNLAQLKEILQTSSRKQAAPLSQSRDRPTEDDLREALANSQFQAYYQPKVSLIDHHVTGFEALARWSHPDKGMIPPGIFIPIAEECGLIDELTSTILSHAFHECGRWARADMAAKVAVNMSARVLTDLSLPERLLDLSRENGIAPASVVIELTEGAVAERLTTLLDILTRIRMKGFMLSIDDFGTGYSSLSRIHSLPFNELKIDQSFVREAPTSHEARSIVETTVDLGRKLGMRLVAEGIENQECWDLLESLGSNEAQGYFIAKPMPAEAVLDWRLDWDKRHV
ncbi:Regulatory protein for cyclic-di-GMP, EAL domain [Rhodospirillaceae bacterium LM-1]|nr:Regulatory protein for cyclic-di-GMP, EAL domain [Rhodospirillaceae bacterium LM-1]